MKGEVECSTEWKELTIDGKATVTHYRHVWTYKTSSGTDKESFTSLYQADKNYIYGTY